MVRLNDPARTADGRVAPGRGLTANHLRLETDGAAQAAPFLFRKRLVVVDDAAFHAAGDGDELAADVAG